MDDLVGRVVRWLPVLGLTFCAGACISGQAQGEGAREPEALNAGDAPAAEQEAGARPSVEEAMTGTEMQHALDPCGHLINAPGGVDLVVRIDADGNPLEAHAYSLGGNTFNSFIECAEREMMRAKFNARGRERVIGARVGM